jgi:ATP-binding cassette subfamily F protein 3
LVGPNGAGKTTLLKTLTGQIPGLKGRHEFGTNVKPGYYAQSHEQLNASGTVLSTILHAQPLGEEFARTYLGRFLFSEDDVFKTVPSLSGGERSRLALAVLLLQQANFLILDEPTNHLDISARENLEEMLVDFDGTILFVSHDRYFIDRIATRIWSIDDGGISQFLGGYTDYQRQLGRRAEPPKEPEPVKESAPVETPPAHNTRRADAKTQKAMQTAERDIARLEGRLNEISDALTVASIDSDVEAVGRLGVEYERVQTQLDDAYRKWETISAELEALGAPA